MRALAGGGGGGHHHHHHGGGGFAAAPWGWGGGYWGYPSTTEVFITDSNSNGKSRDNEHRAMAYIMSLPKAQRAAAYKKLFGKDAPQGALGAVTAQQLAVAPLAVVAPTSTASSSSTLKWVAIGGAAVLAVYFIRKRLARK